MLVLHHPKYLIQGGLRYLSIQGLPKSGGCHFESPHIKDFNILGSMLGSLILGHYHIEFVQDFEHQRYQPT